MSGFKLLAIRPLEGCSKKFSKILEDNRIYKFYQDYIFSIIKDENNQIVNRVDYYPTVPEYLYDVDRNDQNELRLNISAIVGKNGSGKSSLLDLFYVAIFLLADQEGILPLNSGNRDEHLSKLSQQLEKHRATSQMLQREETLLELFSKNPFQKHRDVYFEIFRQQNFLDDVMKIVNRKIDTLKSVKKNLEELLPSIKVEIYFQNNGIIYRLKVDGNNKVNQACTIDKIPSNLESKNDDDLIDDKGKYNLSSHFFYSVALNYSHYSLNANEIGVWINELFHKNDGYQTPVVINPMREDGIIDINNENHLVRSRLLSNIFTPVDLKNNEINSEEWWNILKNSPRHLAENKIAHRIKIKINEDKISKGSRLNKEEKKAWKIIEGALLSDRIQDRRETDWDEYAKIYLVNKMKSIAENYDPYKSYMKTGKLVNNEIKDYALELMSSGSHISYKFKQAINFLKYDYAKHYEEAESVTDIHVLSQNITDLKLKEDTIDIVPPSFLKVDVIFSEKGDDLSDSLNAMSSGERQKIYSLSSVTYHLQYVDSVVKSDKLPLKYNHINLLFDEIELYYHPDLQRTFISDLRNAISRVNLKSIKSINCVFATHSPFILSDIPTQNILQLDNSTGNKLKVSKTFGANIHDLLRDSFFMENGLIGSFSKSKINELINYLGDNRVALNSKKYNLTSERAEEIINLIGEPVLRDALFESLEIKRRLSVREEDY